MQAVVMQLQRGERIYGAGESADCAFLIVSGRVEIRRDGTLLTVLETGELFGEDGLISEKPRNTDAVAAEACTLRRIDGNSFSDTVRQDPDAAVQVLRVMLERLRGGKRFRPRPGRIGARLVALTPEAMAALGDEARLIASLPCRIGRRSADTLRTNEIELVDQKPFQVSRSHLVLSDEAGRLVLYDRGSSLGTWVRGQCIGGPSGFDGPVMLGEEPTELVLGHSSSPLRFSLASVAMEGGA